LKHFGCRLLVQVKHCLTVSIKDAQIWMAAGNLSGEFALDLGGFHSGQSSLARTQPDQSQLIVLAGLDLQGSPVSAVGQDRVPEIGGAERTGKAGRIGRGKTDNELTKESLQVHCLFPRLPVCERKFLQRIPAWLPAGFMLGAG
jgi:hypothetical protein